MSAGSRSESSVIDSRLWTWVLKASFHLSKRLRPAMSCRAQAYSLTTLSGASPTTSPSSSLRSISGSWGEPDTLNTDRCFVEMRSVRIANWTVEPPPCLVPVSSRAAFALKRVNLPGSLYSMTDTVCVPMPSVNFLPLTLMSPPATPRFTRASFHPQMA